MGPFLLSIVFVRGFVLYLRYRQIDLSVSFCVFFFYAWLPFDVFIIYQCIANTIEHVFMVICNNFLFVLIKIKSDTKKIRR